MGDYFKPPRRKIGLLTLVSACVFAGGWMRSQWAVDHVYFVPDHQTLHIIYSCPIGIGWNRGQETVDFPHFGPPTGLRSLSSATLTPSSLSYAFPFGWAKEWDQQWLGFRWGNFSISSTPPSPPSVVEVQLWIIPYWSIVAPLTALAAYLLFKPPRAINLPTSLEHDKHSSMASTAGTATDRC